MNVVLWVFAAVLAVAFLAAGSMKLVKSKQQLAEGGMDWVEGASPGAVKALGALEVLAAIGLIVPPLVGVAPVLAPLAAVGLVLVMIGAVILHARKGEASHVVVNLVLLVLAAVVAWGRFGPYAF